MKRLILFIFASVLVCIQITFGQSASRNQKIGLVLSGGGAKGLAHIGVIKVLEEAGIRPDYIIGASMGSIIGGLYASGYSPAELDSIARKIDWDVVLSDIVPLTDVVPEEKPDYNRFQLEFDVTREGIKMPAGLISGQRISELLSGLTWNVSGIESFDDLPIPFRCVAADLITGKPYVFKEGDLSTAMRASMAIPTIFTPVVFNGKYLVDGGVLDNFPVKMCRDLGADIIIGVNVGFKDKPTIEELSSIADILLTSASIGSNVLLDEAVSETDYLITPDLKHYTTSSFYDGDSIIDLGEVAARKQFAVLQDLAQSLNNKTKPVVNSELLTPKEVVVSDIEIRNSEHVSKNYFLNKLGIYPGDSISNKSLDKGVRELIGSRFYKYITYDLQFTDSVYNLIFTTKESGLIQTKFSLHYDNELKAGIISNFTIKNFFTNNSRLSLTFDISENPRLYSDVITYIGFKQNIGFATDVYFEHTPLLIYDANLNQSGVFNFYKKEIGAGLFQSFKTHTLVSASVRWKEIVTNQKSGLPLIFENDINRFGNGYVFGELVADRNTLNKRFFATKGHHLRLKGKYNFVAYEKYHGNTRSKNIVEKYISIPDEKYFTLEMNYSRYYPIFNRSILKTELGLVGSESDAPFYDMHYIGGTTNNISMGDAPFAGLNFREKIAENYGLARFELNLRITKSIYALAITNGIYSPGFGNENFIDDSFFLGPEEYIIGFGGGVGVNSIIGPIIIGVGTNTDDYKARAYFSLGYPFQY